MRNIYTIFGALIAFHVLLSPALAQFSGESSLRLLSPVINTPNHLIERGSHFNITSGIEGYGHELAFVLETNRDLITQGTRIQHVDSYGNAISSDPLSNWPHHITKGSVWMHLPGAPWEVVGWARLTVVRDGLDPLFDGAFTIHSAQYDIPLHLSDENFQKSSKETITAYQATTSNSTGASHDEFSLNRPGCTTTPGSHLSKRQSSAIGGLADNIGDTSGCSGAKRIAYIGIATDCSYRAAFNSRGAVRRNIINVVNTASVVFENSFNITLGIRDIKIIDAVCADNSEHTPRWNAPCSAGDLNWRLDKFSAWRASVDDNNAYWSLMTSCFAPHGEIGVSWVGEVCNSGTGTYTSKSGIGANVVGHSDTEWQVFAHESAHTFGAVHDCDSTTCASGLDLTSDCCPLSGSTCNASGKYLMSPMSSTAMTRFSPCTIGNVCSQLEYGDVNTDCLVSAGEEDFARADGVILPDSQCGNGIVEPGEACDCGDDSCDDWEAGCCDMMTCQWRDEGKCDLSQDDGSSNDSVGAIWRSWIEQHWALFIGLCVGLGGLVAVLVATVIVLAWRRRQQKKMLTKEATLYGEL